MPRCGLLIPEEDAVEEEAVDLKGLMVDKKRHHTTIMVDKQLKLQLTNLVDKMPPQALAWERQ